MKSHAIKLLLLNISAIFSRQLIPQPCFMVTDSFCLFKNLNLRLFQPISPENRLVESLELYNINLSTLSSIFCDTFPNLQYLSITKSVIYTILPDTLNNCKLLKDISFNFNEVESLPSEIFASNRNLTVINLIGNQLKTLPASVFQNKPKLTKLLLSSNKLTYFNEDMLVHLHNLEELRLDSNELPDLSEKTITSSLPNLKRIAITDNDFSCFRLEQMILHYHAKLITFICNSLKPLRHRDYDYREIHCFEYPNNYVPMRCLLDEQWEFEKICKIRLIKCQNCDF